MRGYYQVPVGYKMGLQRLSRGGVICHRPGTLYISSLGGERWAGPAYLNSPPPQALPMPHFLSTSPSPSPAGECPPPTPNYSVESVTMELRRILNIEVGK
ncbi:hypothetical protein Pyn_17834 [Prunus yedoensis var. nudiflora]|uniref:Uncharacterized protein n=1 Tax=Prunus yedoensis var. nudiflora TaxID=2094558 RepID=A0A314YTJ0_PRUYE|nr:hypothetical protein Pyn_17834 [Prunus yedoensis var. nudiflora]